MKAFTRHRALSYRCKFQELFCLAFRRHLRECVARRRSVAEGFGLAWEETIDKVPLDDEEQGRAYQELIVWARTQDLFTRPEHESLLAAWAEQ
jgi:hypothetical protein